MTKSFVESTLCEQDASFEVPLRPQSLDDFLGQESVRDRLEVYLRAAQQRGDPLGHCLFCGPPGLGKTTLANILAKAMGTNIVVTAGPVIDKPGDLAGVLTNLQEGDILFIDEIHRLSRSVEEYLYPAMEDFTLDLIIDSGPSARSVQVKLNKFTLVGATTRLGLLTGPMRSRFGITCRLDYYDTAVLQSLVSRVGRMINIDIDDAGAHEIACRARGTPRIAINLVRWVRDFAQIHTEGKVDAKIARQALEMLAIDELGLDELDKRILEIIIDHYNGGPVGVGTLAVALGEEKSTLEEVYEPFLITQGMMQRTPRGREATARAYRHLDRPIPKAMEENT